MIYHLTNSLSVFYLFGSHGIQYYLGTFETQEAAAKAYEEKSVSNVNVDDNTNIYTDANSVLLMLIVLRLTLQRCQQFQN